MATGDMNSIANRTFVLLVDSVRNRHPIDLLSTSINMVPSGLRDLDPSSYDPRVVSIGPLHREDKNVQYYEELKANYVDKLLHDLNIPPEETLFERVEKVLASIDQIRACYAGTNINKYEDTILAKMMVMDACFIIHFTGAITASKGMLQHLLRGSSIIYDLVLVENKIPFFVLQDVFDCTVAKSQRTKQSLTDFMLKFVQYLNVFETDITVCNNDPSEPHDHILGFLEKCYWPLMEDAPSLLLPRSAIHSTIELDRAGVIFKPNENKEWQMAMEFKPAKSALFSWFWGKPTLRMPVLRIDNFTELVLRNLIAYEQYFATRTYVTSYAMAMDMLVDSEEDIAKLIESKVVVNHLGSNEKAANAVNSLCRGLPVLNFCYVPEWQDMDAHYNRYWPKNIAALKRTYFSSPWNIIALLSGIVLFALTVVQTIYTVNAA